MSDLEHIVSRLEQYRDERNWKKYHNPKDLALSLTLEAAEVLEHFQWRNGKELDEYVKTHKDEIGEELADVFNWVLLMSHDLGIDIIEAANKKIDKNDFKYPADKFRDRHN
jgi:NTP pyrophosphatase (non-canonical NTP hydrolase)